MKGISLWQPWASLWLTPFKIHETRHWRTDYRGPLLVHAAKRLVSDCGEELDELCIEAFGPYWRTELPRGSVIGRVHLVSLISSNEFIPVVDSPDRICGNWDANRWGWKREVTSAVRFENPIPFLGRQGFFNVPDDLLEEK